MTWNSKRLDRCALGLLFLVELSLFTNFYRREIAWNVPTAFDQCVYLLQSYKAQARVLDHGLAQLPLAAYESVSKVANGCALPYEGAGLALVLGGTRFPRLLVNLLAFFVAQAFVFTTAMRTGAGRAASWTAIGLILCQRTAWFWAGGLFDFRIDFFAYCFYGAWACAVIRSNVFLDRRWSIGAGLLAALLALNRFVTLTYLAGVCSALAVVFCTVWWTRRHDAASAARSAGRLVNLFLSIIPLLVLVGPVLWLDRQSIFDYYVVGHLLGSEKYIRLREVGVADLKDFLLFYPHSILEVHLGKVFVAAGVVALAAAGLGRLAASRGAQATEPIRRPDSRRLQFLFLSLAILIPVVLLTCDISKSPVVGGIVGIPIALLVAVLVVHRDNAFARGGAMIVFVLGMANTLDHASQRLPSMRLHADLQRVVDMGEWMTQYSFNHHWKRPLVSYDMISNDYNAYALACVGYERCGELVDFIPLLGASILKIGRADAMSDLAQSDFAILTTAPKIGPYPFYDGIKEYENDLDAWAAHNMKMARTFDFDGNKVTLYVRRLPPAG
jgi:hypothetical protein